MIKLFTRFQRGIYFTTQMATKRRSHQIASADPQYVPTTTNLDEEFNNFLAELEIAKHDRNRADLLHPQHISSSWLANFRSSWVALNPNHPFVNDDRVIFFYFLIEVYLSPSHYDGASKIAYNLMKQMFPEYPWKNSSFSADDVAVADYADELYAQSLVEALYRPPLDGEKGGLGYYAAEEDYKKNQELAYALEERFYRPPVLGQRGGAGFYNAENTFNELHYMLGEADETSDKRWVRGDTLR